MMSLLKYIIKKTNMPTTDQGTVGINKTSMPVNSLMTKDTVNNPETLMGILEKNITKTILYMKSLYMKSSTIK